jgi:iron(III) transport system substrate-binding protein
MKRYWIIALIALAFVIAACAPAPTPAPTAAPPTVAKPAPTAVPPTAAPVATKPAPTVAPTSAPAATKESFDLDALIAAAKKEGTLTAYFTSSRITVAGKNFEAKYGIKVNGTKMADPEQTERLIRETDSKNVQVDVLGYEDGPTLEARLIPQGYAISWMPPNLTSVIPPQYQNPVIYQLQPRMFGYNTEVYGDKCPITNVWQLTEPKWKSKVILRDPAQTPANIGFFAALVSNPKLLEDAYKELYGKPLETKEENAGYEFLKRLAKNDVIPMKADGDIGDAVGAAGQKEPPIGMYTLTKHRDVKDKNLKIATCRAMQPFMGYALPTYLAIAKNAPHPNAAKLFVHFLLTPEGIAPWTVDDLGGFSTNPNAFVNPMNEGKWSDWEKKLVPLDNKATAKLQQKLIDFWLTSTK